MDAEALRAKLAEVEAERDALRAHVAEVESERDEALASLVEASEKLAEARETEKENDYLWEWHNKLKHSGVVDVPSHNKLVECFRKKSTMMMSVAPLCSAPSEGLRTLSKSPHFSALACVTSSLISIGWLDVPKDLSSVIMGCSRRPADAAAAAPADARRGLPPCPLISEVSNRASLSLSLNGNRRQSVEAKFLG